MVETQDWQDEAVRLKVSGMESKDIAEVVGKSAATVRKAIAKARERGELDTNGHGDPAHIPGQTTVDDHLYDDASGPGMDPRWKPDVLPEDDPDHPGWAGRDEFVAEAGEAVGDMPKAPEPDAGETEVRVKGTRQMAIDFGPFAQLPSGGTLVLKSERLASGHFGLGDIVSGSFTARVTDVGGKERFDKDFEEWQAKPTAYVATITEVAWGHSVDAQELGEALAMCEDAALGSVADLLRRFAF